MAKALAYAKYDYKFIFGYGNHSAQHGQARQVGQDVDPVPPSGRLHSVVVPAAR